MDKLQYDDAFYEGLTFEKGKLKWSESLSKVARDYLNEAAPCDLGKTSSGLSIIQIFQRYVLNYDDVEIVTFKGLEKNNGQELLETMLAHQNFED